MVKYIHGYSTEELQRLYDQSHILNTQFHQIVRFPAKHRVFEVGCGVGAQTRYLVKNNPQTEFVSLDISHESLSLAKQQNKGHSNHLGFLQTDLFHLPFQEQFFDHLFICFVLEHLDKPLEALCLLKKYLKSNGTITVIEGDHGSAFFHPKSESALHVWNCLIQAQAKYGGNSLIGRELYPLLYHAGFQNIHVVPQFIYADASRPEWVEWFTLKTITAMVMGVRQQSLEMGLTDEKRWEEGITALKQTAKSPGGVFCYTFFQATARKG